MPNERFKLLTKNVISIVGIALGFTVLKWKYLYHEMSNK